MFIKNKLSALFASASLCFCMTMQAGAELAGCETVANVQGICGFPAPEDIDVFSGGQYLLFSPVTGVNGTELESLYLFDVHTLVASPISYQTASNKEQWGDARCIDAPGEKFSPHGIHISQRSDGRWQVLAVNHLRESVEMFEVAEGKVPSLIWRGCVLAPEKSNLNDVVALPDGGFLVSHMFDRGTMEVMAAMQATVNTGYVWRWQPSSGFEKLPGSDGIVPNGLALTADGQSLFMSETGGQKIKKINYATGQQEGQVKLGPVDNLSWAADGRLIVTRIIGPMPEDCFSKPGPCLAPFQVLAIDPQTLEYTVLHEQRGKPMGAASIAVVLGDYIYVGSFKGQQILRIKQN